MSSESSESRMVDGLRALATDEPISLTVSGSCMEPVIAPQATIRVEARRRYWPGDILAFRSRRGELTVHRLIGYRLRGRRWLLQTRADAAATLDAPFPSTQVIGRVIGAPEPLPVPLHHRLGAALRFVYLLLTRGLPG